MAKRRFKKDGTKIMVSLLLSLIGTTSEALCLKDCRVSAGSQVKPKSKISFNNSSRSSNSISRQQSHDVSHSKNAITGDLHLQVGHQHMEINNSNAANSPINASVTSVINLGDVITTGDTHN